jgi:hypothetical protein
MRPLTDDEIATLANRNTVKKTAVENFLMSMPLTDTIGVQRSNARMDASLYRWNAATLHAIFAGIDLAYGR